MTIRVLAPDTGRTVDEQYALEMIEFHERKIEAGKRYRIESEFAAWFDEIEADAQVATVTAAFDRDAGRLGIWPGVHYAVAGTVVECCWASHYGGVAFGTGEDTRGQRRTKHVGVYGYAAAAAIADGTLPIELAPEFEVVVDGEIETTRWDEQARAMVPCTNTTYTIRRKAGED